MILLTNYILYFWFYKDFYIIESYISNPRFVYHGDEPICTQIAYYIHTTHRVKCTPTKVRRTTVKFVTDDGIFYRNYTYVLNILYYKQMSHQSIVFTFTYKYVCTYVYKYYKFINMNI